METLYHDWLTPPKKLLFWGQRIQSFIVSLCVNVGRSMYTAGSQSGWWGGWLQEWSLYSPSGINRERLDKGPFTMECRMHKQIINHVAWGCILENSTGWDRTQNPELSMTTDASSPLGGKFSNHFQLNFFISCKQSVLCLKQWDLTIYLLRATKSKGKHLHFKASGNSLTNNSQELHHGRDWRLLFRTMILTGEKKCTKSAWRLWGCPG